MLWRGIWGKYRDCSSTMGDEGHRGTLGGIGAVGALWGSGGYREHYGKDEGYGNIIGNQG